jgi:ParB family transcriptional regulator, chromosome partitioning protein
VVKSAPKVTEVPQLNHLNVLKKGQGVNSLFSSSNPNLVTATENPSHSHQRALKVDQIIVATQVRRYFDPEKQKQLETSIAKQGILNPLIVRPIENERFELVAGERRYRAAIALGFPQVPVEIRSLDPISAKEVALTENLQRSDLNALEETEGILDLLELRLTLSKSEVISLLYRAKNELDGKVTQNVLRSEMKSEIDMIFNELGRMSWDSFVSSRLPLLSLPPEILEVLRQGRIAYTKAKAIAVLKPENLRQELLQQAISQGLSLSQIKEQVKKLNATQSKNFKSSPNAENWCKEIIQKVAKTKPWNQPDKWLELERLFKEIEAYLET